MNLIIGACFTEGQKHVNAGRLNKALIYEDGALELIYKDGDACPGNPNLKYTSIVSFVCQSDAGPGSKPVIVSFDDSTCTYYFSWRTPLACEEESVVRKF